MLNIKHIQSTRDSISERNVWIVALARKGTLSSPGLGWQKSSCVELQSLLDWNSQWHSDEAYYQCSDLVSDIYSGGPGFEYPSENRLFLLTLLWFRACVDEWFHNIVKTPPPLLHILSSHHLTHIYMALYCWVPVWTRLTQFQYLSIVDIIHSSDFI